ncbi:MAG: sulfotransferase [Planctomycetota bacterium]|nr:MAG: sulfotransferase [Planctomycetota bacterium]
MSTSVPFFVLGCPRSGTSWLADVLDQHHLLRVSQELNIPGLVRGVQNVAAHRAKMERVGREEHDLARELGPALVYVGELVARELAQSGKQRYGDKYPGYATCIPTLEALFPGAQFVHIVRDGRDVAQSLLANQAALRLWRNAEWTPKTYAAAAAMWHEHVAGARAHAARLGPARYHELCYEELVAAPQATLAKLLAFLGVELEADGVAGGVRAALARVSSQPRRWTETLAPSELAQFASYAPAEELLAALGYPATPAPRGGADFDAHAASRSAQRACAEGRSDAAIAELRAHAAAGADHPLLWSDLAVLENGAGRSEEAVRLLVRALRTDQPPLEAALNLLALPQRDESVFALEHAFAGEHPELITAIHGWLLARGASAAAAEAISIARIQAPRAFARSASTGEQAEHALACRLHGDGRAADAEARWQRLHERGSQLGSIGLGLVEFQRGRTREAAEHFHSVARAEQPCLEALAFVLARVKSREVGAAAFERALAFAHQDAAFAQGLVAWLVQQGLDVEASEAVVRCFQRGATPAEAQPRGAELRPQPRAARAPASAGDGHVDQRGREHAQQVA